jgi:hypothetical protein
MLKAELGYNLTTGVATADDQQLYRLIDNEQKRLAAAWSWPFLDKYADVAATVTTRNLTYPTVLGGERPIRVQRKYNTLWQDIVHGITDTEYNIVDSDASRTQDPIQRWRLNSDGTTFEVWPIPATAQTVRFHTGRVLTSLLTAGSYDSTKTLDLDDLLVVLYVAANRLARMKQQDAPLMLQRAESHFRMLKASAPAITEDKIVLGGDIEDRDEQRRNVGITVVVAS